MNSRWKMATGRLTVFISLVWLLILMMSLNGTRTAGMQNNFPLLTLAGDAVLLEDRLRLTADQDNQTGAAWLTNPSSVDQGFVTTVDWQILRSDPAVGADGFAFVIQNDSSSALGSGGSGIGYQGIANSLAVEFDTSQNPPEEFESGAGDPNGNHLSVQTRGTQPNSADPTYSRGFTTDIPVLSDGNVHTSKIFYAPGTLLIFLDDLANPILTVPVDLETTLNLDPDQTWVGFTAATGGRSQAHDILSFTHAETE
jgi:peptide-N4-(N-acetyl-beta-glucosaminyl)asparagine amidase